MKLTSTNITLILLNCLVIWLGLQATVAEGIDGKGRLVSCFLLLIMLSNILANKRFIGQFKSRNSPLTIWILWWVYAVINSVFQYAPTERQSTTLFLTTELLLPFVLMASVSSIKPDKVVSLLRGLQAGLLIFFVMLAFNAKLIGGRLVFERFDPNELSLYMYAIAYIVALNYFCGLQRYVMTLIAFVPIIAFSVLIGSRMGFAGMTILLLGFLVATRKKVISYKRLLLVTPVLLFVVFYVINDTALGDRLLETTTQTEGFKESPVEDSILKYYGDRGIYYVLGWQAFLDSPIFGIGLKNFKDNYYPTVLHSEIMIQLAELGIVGFALYILFWKRVISSVYRKSIGEEVNSPAINYTFYVVLVLIFASTNLFLYSSFSVALIFGLIALLTRDDVSVYVGDSAMSKNKGSQ